MVTPTRRQAPEGGRAGVPGTRREREVVPGTAGEAGFAAPCTTQDEDAGPARRQRLPSALEGRYTILGRLGRGGQAKILLVEDATHTQFVIKIYGNEAFAAKAEVLERVGRTDPEHVVRLFEHDLDDDGDPYEVLEYLPLGTLADLIAREDPTLPSERVKDILRQLAAALAHVHTHRIDHKDLNPSNVLVRSEQPLDLVLSDFGIAGGAEGSMRASTFIGGTFAYAPPEAHAQVAEEDEASGTVKRKVVLHATKWDFWSLGMMLVEMLSGRHPFDRCDNMTIVSRLATQNVDDLVAGVGDPSWHKLCRGLLRRDPKKRWGQAEVEAWLRNPLDPSLVVAEEAAPSRTGFRFVGRDCHTQEELAAAFASHWDEAADLWRQHNRRLRDWLRDELGLSKLAQALKQIDETPGLDLDAQLFRVISALDPNPPSSFRGLDLTGEKLKALADRAPSDAHDSDVLRRLHRSRILSIAASLPGGKGLGSIAKAWQGVVDEYEELRGQIGSATNSTVQLPDLDEDNRTKLLAAATPGSVVLEALRARAQQAATSSARKCPWFRELGEAASAAPPVALASPFLASHAEAQVRAARVARAERNGRLWRCLGVGAVSGLIVGALWWWGVSAYCGANRRECHEFNWFTQTLHPLDVVLMGALVVSIIALMFKIHAKTIGGG